LGLKWRLFSEDTVRTWSSETRESAVANALVALSRCMWRCSASAGSRGKDGVLLRSSKFTHNVPQDLLHALLLLLRALHL
jgi:hypothetical protein